MKRRNQIAAAATEPVRIELVAEGRQVVVVAPGTREEVSGLAMELLRQVAAIAVPANTDTRDMIPMAGFGTELAFPYPVGFDIPVPSRHEPTERR